MTTDLEKLARRGAACPKWKWLGGMQIVHTPEHDGDTGCLMRLPQDGYVPADNEYADLADPVTVGCLLVLVRQAWGHTTLASTYSEYVDRDEWSVMPRVTEDRMTTFVSFRGATEAEALIAALEAAP